MRFSERYKYKPVREVIQIESMDEPLRNGIWSLLKLFYWDEVHHSSDLYGGYYLSSIGNERIKALCELIWFDLFKIPLDQIDDNWKVVLKQLRDYFFGCAWFEVYDFIEFIAKHYSEKSVNTNFMEACNGTLEKEMSAFRFANGIITRITGQQEIEEIEKALGSSVEPVATHLQRALELLSDRSSHDYRNSIKESISAVESLVARIAKTEKGTLGQLLKKLEDSVGLHPALKAAFSSLYGYTSDENGIRHALHESDKVDFHDAKFMLVVCSTFINYVEGKVQNSCVLS